CLDVPGEWAKELGLPWVGRQWATINLRDKERMPLYSRVENPQRREELIKLIREDRANARRRAVQGGSLLESRQLFASAGLALTAPHRVQAFCLRPDLDGFSAVVKAAFETKNEKVVEQVARGFAEILAFGDYMENSTPGAIRLPWAGD